MSAIIKSVVDDGTNVTVTFSVVDAEGVAQPDGSVVEPSKNCTVQDLTDSVKAWLEKAAADVQPAVDLQTAVGQTVS